MQYLIRFEINLPGLESDYIRERNDMLQKRHQDSVLLYTTISGILMQGDLVFDSICFRQGIASGSFSCIYEGFAPKERRFASSETYYIEICTRSTGRISRDTGLGTI